MKPCPAFPPNSEFIKDDITAPGPTGNGDKMVFVVGDDDLYLRVDLEEPGMWRKLVSRVMRCEWFDVKKIACIPESYCKKFPEVHGMELRRFWCSYCELCADDWLRWSLETTKQFSKLTVQEAQKRGVCRFCEQPFGRAQLGSPHDWKTEFGEMVFPEHIILNFGEEFAHKMCLEKAQNEN